MFSIVAMYVLPCNLIMLVINHLHPEKTTPCQRATTGIAPPLPSSATTVKNAAASIECARAIDSAVAWSAELTPEMLTRCLSIGRKKIMQIVHHDDRKLHQSDEGLCHRLPSRFVLCWYMPVVLLKWLFRLSVLKVCVDPSDLPKRSCLSPPTKG